MQKNRKYGHIVSFYVYLFLLIYFAFKYREDYSLYEKELFFVLLFSYIICGGLFVFAIIRHSLYLFEPFSLSALLYIGIFNYKPIIDLYYSNVSDNGVNVLSGGVKATVIFTIGFICFYFGYYSTIKMKYYKRFYLEKDKINTEKTIISNSKSDWALIGWIISYICCIAAIISQGSSLRYIFSLASSGTRLIDDSNTALLFLSNFGITMATCWLMIIVRPGNKAKKIFITALSLIYLIMRNGRWLILIFVSSPLVFYYTRRRSRPKWTFTIAGGFLLLLIFAWMQLNRANIAFGRQMSGWGENGLTFEILLSPFNTDLSTYRTFYGMVSRFPSDYPYMFGKSFLYVFILFIPRVIWAGKPDNPVRDMIEHSLNNLARRSGTAVANIGEFYANFGIAGVFILMFTFGKIISKLKKLYNKPTEDSLIIYAILLPLLFQWIARGNFSGNFYTTVFALLPFILKSITRNFLRSRE